MTKLGPLKRTTYHIIIGTLVSLTFAACDNGNEPTKEDVYEKILAGADSKTWFIGSSKINGDELLLDCLKVIIR